LLLQNELFPPLWQRHQLTPSVMVPWFLKKQGQPLLVARSTPVYGQHAPLIQAWHSAAGLEVELLSSEPALAQALVDKYTFILTINALGLARDISLAEWLTRDPELVATLASELSTLGARLCERPADVAQAVLATRQGVAAMGAIKARGRSAQVRVARALGHAARLGVELPTLRALGVDRTS
jgi:hypothetical protein